MVFEILAFIFGCGSIQRFAPPATLTELLSELRVKSVFIRVNPWLKYLSDIGVKKLILEASKVTQFRL
jgi:hypothetical protein